MQHLPELDIVSLRRIRDDGRHNAFTDMCRFDGRIYLAFRSSPSGHDVRPDSCIVILSSADGVDWCETARLAVPDRDLRDPHFMVFRGRLWVYSGAWYCDPVAPERHSVNDMLGYAAWTQDGRNWSALHALEGTYGHYIWRCATHAGRAYLCGRRTHDFVSEHHPDTSSIVRESALLESEDGLVWRWAGLFQTSGGSETAFLFEDDGAIVAVARDKPHAWLCRARPPYREWSRLSLGRYIGGPLLVKWNGRYLVGGRKMTHPDAPDKHPRTVLSWLADGQLHDVLELPSGGDNSYPGFVALDDERCLVSYYSSHEGSGGKVAPAHIYLAELRLQ